MTNILITTSEILIYFVSGGFMHFFYDLQKLPWRIPGWFQQAGVMTQSKRTTRSKTRFEHP